MTIRPPGWMQADTYSAENDRLDNIPFTSSVGSSTSPQFTGNNGWDGGVGLNYGQTCFKVVQNGSPNMSVNVGTGFGFIPGQSTTTQGMYTVVSDAVTNLAIATANATNPRIDLVYAQARDAFYSGTFSDFTFAVVTGTPAPVPVVPALPANSIPLARVAVAANATQVLTGNITDVRLGQGSSGGLVQAPSAFMPTYAPAGQTLWQPDTGKIKVYSNFSNWEDLMQPGAWISYSPTWATTAGSVAINNGTLSGRYSKIGRQVTVQINWVAGTTTSFGTAGGNWNWGLPFTSASTAECASGSLIGTCANNIIIGITDIVNPSSTGFAWAINTNATANASANTQVGQGNPHTFVSGDSLRMLFIYESAV
jgi:hypothetical protein